LTTAIIGRGITRIVEQTFDYSGLKEIYFLGDAPEYGGHFSLRLSAVFYLPGTKGWGGLWGGVGTYPWALPYPVIIDLISSKAAQTSSFGFIISWAATNVSVVVEAASAPSSTTWTPVGTNSIVGGATYGGWSYFSDPQWTNYPARVYRVRLR
jgi:hypothetical protein